MNPKLYTDEFRNFKFLKSSPEQVAYFKKTRAAANLIQSWQSTNDPNFNWSSRIEFIEQLLDLREDTLYIVFAGLLTNNNEYEDSRILIIEKPVVLNHNPIIHKDVREASTDDIFEIENNPKGGYCLVEGKSFRLGLDNEIIFDPYSRIFNISSLPIIPQLDKSFTEMFYDEGESNKYKKYLTDMLRHQINTVSTFTNRL